MLHDYGGSVGAGVSGVFLWLIGILNLIVLIDIVRIFREMRGGHYDDERLENRLLERGMMSRCFGRFFRLINKSWQMYPLGVLFGLGFDTATEVGLLAVAAGVATHAVPFLAVLSLPILFAAGMSLMDTLDGAFMTHAYGWAFSNPIRKVYYNITVTSLSIVVALAIGTDRAAPGHVDQPRPQRPGLGLPQQPRFWDTGLRHGGVVHHRLGSFGLGLEGPADRGPMECNAHQRAPFSVSEGLLSLTSGIQLIGAPFDGFGRVGHQARAAEALRDAGLEGAFGEREVGRTDFALPTADPGRAAGSGLMNEAALLALVEALREHVGAALAAGRFPIVYGGECSVLLGAVSGLARPPRPGRPGLCRRS